jgi:16S rRNA (guanine527-N7)-methyltransferase
MKELAQYAQSLFGIRLTHTQLSALRIYENDLLDWNTRFNLTAIENPEQVRSKHFLDSLSCLLVMNDPKPDRVIDVGTGAGFPGIPLKIILPGMQLTLVESVGKKADFCRHIAQKLQLEGVNVIQERAEVLGKSAQHRERYDWATARAVANMPVLMELLLPFVRVGGKALAMKGVSAPTESQTAERAIRLLGGHLQRLVAVNLPGVADQRYLVVIEKVAATPPAYPRRVGMPAKKPL